jgi:hypothetical protein
MNSLKIFLKIIGLMTLVILLEGCAPPAATPNLPITFPPPPTPVPNSPPPTLTQPAQPFVEASICEAGDWPMKVFRSIDGGVTWITVVGCIHDSGTISPADLTPQVIDGHIVLFFVNLIDLDKGILYRVDSLDGVNFDKPQAVYEHTKLIMDPFVLRMPDGSFRMYATADPEGMLTAVSKDGFNFTSQGRAQLKDGPLGLSFGGMAGALVTPDNRIRLFLDGGANSQGIVSLISDDGLTFTPEAGMRILLPPDHITINNPEPIRLLDGTYLMLYSTQDKLHTGRPDWMAEIRLATSKDGINWINNPTVIGYAGTTCVVEMPDRTQLIYYDYGLVSP